MSKALHEVNWSHLGKTEEFKELKSDLAHVTRDVQGFIDEIVINDIVQTFLKHGYVIVKTEGSGGESKSLKP